MIFWNIRAIFAAAISGSGFLGAAKNPHPVSGFRARNMGF